jgi:flavin reductase (DIM6/NTAB) family NADH-FMN oxidoreductase RutF
MASETVQPPRVRECPIQLEATLENTHTIGARDPRVAVAALALEVRGPRLHVSRLARAPELRYAPPSVQIAAAMRAAFARR